jgi:hypothetical protein
MLPVSPLCRRKIAPLAIAGRWQASTSLAPNPSHGPQAPRHALLMYLGPTSDRDRQYACQDLGDGDTGLSRDVVLDGLLPWVTGVSLALGLRGLRMQLRDVGPPSLAAEVALARLGPNLIPITAQSVKIDRRARYGPKPPGPISSCRYAL